MTWLNVLVDYMFAQRTLTFCYSKYIKLVNLVDNVFTNWLCISRPLIFHVDLCLRSGVFVQVSIKVDLTTFWRSTTAKNKMTYRSKIQRGRHHEPIPDFTLGKRPKRRRLTKICAEIKDLLEFYFSNANLARSSYMRDLVGNDKLGLVPIDILLSFNKMKELGATEPLVRRGLRSSKKLISETVCILWYVFKKLCQLTSLNIN